MKIPLDWLKDYIEINKTPAEIAASFTQLGLLLDKPIKDNVLDLEHRMDRSDWLSVLGCARDLAAFESMTLKYPKLHIEKGTEPQNKVKISVECPDLVYRFNTRVFRGIKVATSPEWLKQRLEAYGIPSINNIVDITNYVMVELGQPMHAQDLAKMEKQEIVIRRANDGEQMTTLLGETVSLDQSMFVLTQNNKPTVIGGIVGGKATAVDFGTTEIVLDAGNYNQNNVRKSSRKLKIQNETVLRYDKFLHPELTQLAIQRATALILDLAGGTYYENEDYYPTTIPTKIQKLRFSRLQKVGGMNIFPAHAAAILTRLEYKILEQTSEHILVEVPYFRTDVEVEDDLVADILRINNYTHINPMPLEAAPPADITPKEVLFAEQMRDALVSLGAHEHITDPLVEVSESAFQVRLENALSSEKGALRTSIYETLIKVADIYKKHRVEDISLFEIGLIYQQHGNPSEFESFKEIKALEYIYQQEGKDFSQVNKMVKSILAGLFNILGIKEYELSKTPNGANIVVDRKVVGELKIDSFTIFYQELAYLETQNIRVIPEIQNISLEDITFTAKLNTPMGGVFNYIKNFHQDILRVYLVEEFLLDEDTKAITFRIEFESFESAQTIREPLIKSVQNDFEVKLRGSN